MKDKTARMRELIEELNKASKAYYVEGREIISNFEYDKLYDELLELEKETGIELAGSPTQEVGYEVLSELPKEVHPTRMLSLNKTKSREELAEWLGNNKGLLSWKLDGLTIVLTYENGELVKAVTRGNGQIGEVVTANAKTFVNLPVKIGYKGAVTLRGEAVISYKDFEEINEKIPEVDAKYKNPRNLCSGSVRQLNSGITKERKVRFYAFSLVSQEGDYPPQVEESREAGLKWLESLGFDIVNYRVVDGSNVIEGVSLFEGEIEDNPIPSDGLVLTLEDLEYSRSLGTTAKFPRDSIAFKWRDQIAETSLRDIQWSASRTGLINPVAIFDPVELEGTTVTRASLHNISIMEDLKLGIGDRIQVYKANMIIPQIAENLTMSGKIDIPSICPVCRKPTEIKNENGVKTLVCNNKECPAKHIKSFSHFVSRDAMDVEGLSEMTVEKLVSQGIIKDFADIFKLENHKDEIVNMEGFGLKSYENLLASCEKAKDTTPDRLLYSLGLPGIGSANAKVIAKACKNNWDRIQGLTESELTEIEGVGDILAKGFREYFDNPENQIKVQELLKVIRLDEEYNVDESSMFMEGKTFVITGSLNHFANRDALVEVLESKGAKVAGSVSSKTSYLINNDLTSNSGKNKKAKELGIPIVDEETVMDWLEKGSVE
ncbi:MAG: NAD-dependent DNA ligase LigA [Firmicutes bacterium]|nr:NAD-dependent DNA ligase LigA [Bacillota bacterium]